MYLELTFDEAREKYKRCRNTQYYVCKEPGESRCAHCGKLITEDPSDGEPTPPGYLGNRAIYSPRVKKSAILHYTCAWETVLARIFATGTVVTAKQVPLY